jgi:hypothetical protein
VHLGVNGGAETWHRDQTGKIRQFAGADQRQQHRRYRGERGSGGAAKEEQQVPAEEKRFLQVCGRGGALRNYG